MLLQALCIISQPSVISNWRYSPETPNLGQNRPFLKPCDLAIWRMTLKNNRAPLLSNIKLCATFHHHMWIQTGVTVRKRLNPIHHDLCDLDLWPLTLTFCMDITSVNGTPENFRMIRWLEHSEKGVTDGRTDRQTERSVLRAAWSQLKIHRKTFHDQNRKRFIQCTPVISRLCILRNWIYRSRMLDPNFWRPRTRYFSRNRGNSLDPIRGRQFFAKPTLAYLSMRAGTHAVRWSATPGGALTPPLCRRVGSS